MTDPATLIGLLADEHRLRVFAAVALGARTVAEVAERSGLDETDVQGALPRLVGAGLVAQEDGLHVPLEALRAAARRRPERAREPPMRHPTSNASSATSWWTAASSGYLRGTRRSRSSSATSRAASKRAATTRSARSNELARAASTTTRASLRRYLVDEGMLEREAGVYRRP